MITTPTQETTQQARTQTMMPLLALCLGYFMTILDVTIVNVALVNIKEQLGANVAGLQWIVDGYALIFASFLLTGGALGDRRGNRTIFLAGFALFTLASTLCSLAPSLLVLQIARAFQGLGAALLVPNSLALLNTIYTDARKRAQAIGIWAAVASIGALSGPLLGGFLVNAFGWRSIFLINLPIGILGFLLTGDTIQVVNPQGRERRLPVDSFPGGSSTLNRQRRKVLAVDAINTYFTEVDQILQAISQRYLQQVLCLLKQAYVRDIVDTITNMV